MTEKIVIENDKVIEVEKDFELGVMKSFGYLLLMLLVLPILIGIPMYLLSKLVELTDNDMLITVNRIVLGILTNILVLLIVLRLIRKKYNQGFYYKFKGGSNKKNMILISLFMIGFSFVYTNSIGLLTVKIPMPEDIDAALKALLRFPFVFYISIIVIAPIFEEYFMRGIILEGLLNRYKPITAIVISSLFFGLIHMNLGQFIFATLLGMILGYVYYKTKSLKLVILGHAVNNAVAVFGPEASLLILIIGIIIITVVGYTIMTDKVLSTE